MNKRIFKRIMSLVLVVVMAVSTMMVSAVSTSAATGNAEYKFDIQTAGSDGTSIDDISIKVNGENGSTSWHNVGKVAKGKKGSCSFSDINIGTIKSITVKNSGIDGWYPEIIKYTKQNGGERFDTTLYGGRWVDDKKEVTISVTDRAAKVTVQTDDATDAGTDTDILLKLVDEKGNSTGETNLSSIHPELDAFERSDLSTFYIYVPENFGTPSKVEVEHDSCFCHPLFWPYVKWYLDYIDVTLDGETQRFGAYTILNDRKCNLYPSKYYYKVTAKTSDKFCAGTDNNIFLNTYNNKNKFIADFLLDDNKNNFERDDTDVFYITISQKIENIKIRVWDVMGSDWHLDYIQLDLLAGRTDDTVVESTKYKFNQWIAFEDTLYKPKSKEVLL